MYEFATEICRYPLKGDFAVGLIWVENFSLLNAEKKLQNDEVSDGNKQQQKLIELQLPV